MLNFSLLATAVVASVASANAESVHGENAEGNVMGPVAFLWPSDRPWDADDDNTGPCGSIASPGKRTEFPLEGGSVALSIADDAWNVDFRIAMGSNPTSQDQFIPILGEISEIEAGHQCYSVPNEALQAANAGGPGTIQMEYWSSDDTSPDGKNQSFYACADVTFVTVKAFTINPPCFNVTADDFDWSDSSSKHKGSGKDSSKGDSNDASKGSGQESSSTDSDDGSSGLSAGDKAGIAIGTIVGAGILISIVVLFLMRRRKNAHSATSQHVGSAKVGDAESLGSRAETTQVAH